MVDRMDGLWLTLILYVWGLSYVFIGLTYHFAGQPEGWMVAMLGAYFCPASANTIVLMFSKPEWGPLLISAVAILSAAIAVFALERSLRWLRQRKLQVSV